MGSRIPTTAPPTAGDNLFPAANPRQKVCAKKCKDTDLKRLQRPRFSHKHRERGICQQNKNTDTDPDLSTRCGSDYFFSRTRALIDGKGRLDGNDWQREYCKRDDASDANLAPPGRSADLASYSDSARACDAPS